MQEEYTIALVELLISVASGNRDQTQQRLILIPLSLMLLSVH